VIGNHSAYFSVQGESFPARSSFREARHKGETYYVCCSGCRDAFNENPEKYITEFKAKKAGKR
jgi:YHS domain-containing protein